MITLTDKGSTGKGVLIRGRQLRQFSNRSNRSHIPLARWARSGTHPRSEVWLQEKTHGPSFIRSKELLIVQDESFKPIFSWPATVSELRYNPAHKVLKPDITPSYHTGTASDQSFLRQCSEGMSDGFSMLHSNNGLMLQLVWLCVSESARSAGMLSRRYGSISSSPGVTPEGRSMNESSSPAWSIAR
jgi:hypothetical protein